MRRHVRGVLGGLLAALVTFVVLVGVRDAASYASVQTPLRMSLGKIPGVRGVSVQSTSSGESVVLTVAEEADLQTVMDSARARMADGGGHGRIVISDRPDARLEVAARRMAFDIIQATRTGEFAALPSELQVLAQRQGVKVDVSIDVHDLYLELKDGSHFMDIVTPVKP